MMEELSETSKEFVINPNLSAIREISSLKKTCYQVYEYQGIKAFVSYKFGRLSSIIIDREKLDQFFLKSIYDENLISQIVFNYLKNENVTMNEAISILDGASCLGKDSLALLRDRFNAEFLCCLLFDRNSSHCVISSLSYKSIVEEKIYSSILDENILLKHGLGQLILDAYQIEVMKGEIFSHGNLLQFDKEGSVFDELLFEDNRKECPIGELCFLTPGLKRWSYENILSSIEKGVCRIERVEFDNEDSEELFNEKIEKQQELKPTILDIKSANKNSFLENISNIEFLKNILCIVSILFIISMCVKVAYLFSNFYNVLSVL